MDLPRQPVESIPRHRFTPPHCPFHQCAAHRIDDGSFAFRRHGTFRRKNPPYLVQRFVCLTCRRTFSQQSFSCTYYLKRPELLEPVARGLVAGSAHRQIARSLDCSHTTVTRLSARLGRHGLLVHQTMLAAIDTIDEAIVYDHFESFSGSQFLPVGIGTPVGADSGLIYGIDYVEHRRPGRLSPIERRIRDEIEAACGKPEPGGYTRAFEQMLAPLLARCAPEQRLAVVTDGHPGYRAALRRHRLRARVDHRIYPNPRRAGKRAPRSLAVRKRDAAMFPVDQLHALIRHSLAHHRRETIAFCRRVYGMIERLVLAMLWRNLIKAYSERHPAGGTAAMKAKLTDKRWTWRAVLARRLFPKRFELDPYVQALYDRSYETRALGRCTRHALKNAY